MYFTQSSLSSYFKPFLWLQKIANKKIHSENLNLKNEYQVIIHKTQNHFDQ